MLLLVCLAASPRPPSVPVAELPGTALSSKYETRMRTPTLTGETESLDIELMTWVSTRFTLDVDAHLLDEVTPQSRDAVIRSAAADPRWRLLDVDGALVAFRREKHGEVWTVPLRGYHEDDVASWRTSLRFSPWGEEAAWATSPLVSRATAQDSSVKVRAFRLEKNRDWQAIALAWEGAEITLEIFEAGTDETLPKTVEALREALPYGALAASGVQSISERGYTIAAMPIGEPLKSGEPSVTVTSPGPGELEVVARISAPEAGVAWARILNHRLKPWEADAVAVGTRERIGWSTDPKVQFYMQGRFPIAPGPAFSGTVEIWHSAGEAKPVRLLASPITVPAR